MACHVRISMGYTVTVSPGPAGAGGMVGDVMLPPPGSGNVVTGASDSGRLPVSVYSTAVARRKSANSVARSTETGTDSAGSSFACSQGQTTP